MSLSDEILASVEAGDDFPSETIAVPEWGGAKVTVRGLSVGEKRRLFSRSRRFEEAPGGKWTVVPVDDPLADLYLVVASCYDPGSGARVFDESHIDRLAAGGERTEEAVSRIADIARGLSGMEQEPPEGAVTENATAAGKASATLTGGPYSSSPTS